MNFLDKLSKLAESVVTNIEDSASSINKTYQEKGFKGLVDKTNESLDSLAQNSQSYVNKISESNKEILKNNKSSSFEDKLAAAASVVVNTTQTIVDDVVKVTKSTVENISKETETSDIKKTSEESIDKNVQDIISKGKKSNRVYLQDILSDAEIISLDCTPLSIIIEELGGVQDKRIPGKWQLQDYSIIVTNKKWYNFTTGIGNDGALTFLKAALNDFKTIDNDDVNFNNKQTDMALSNLQGTQNEPDYQTKVSAWIKQQIEFDTVRSSVRVTQAQKEDLAEALAETSPKRVRKSKVEVTPVEEPEVVAKTPRKRKLN